MEQRMNEILVGISTASANADQRLGASSLAGSLQTAVPLEFVSDQYLPNFDDFVLDNDNRLLGQQHLDPTQLPELDFSPDFDPATDDAIPIPNNSYPSLPPLATIQPAIEEHFTPTNSLLPLFSPAAFSRML